MVNKKIKSIILRKIFAVYKKKQINAIILFGSRARNDARKDSDYDVAVFINGKEKKENLSDFYDNTFINLIDRENLRYLLENKHSFLFCIFRDGIVLYGRKWFNKKKKEILELKPSKELIFDYLISAFENMIHIKENIEDIKLISLYIEDGKVSANKIGFALIMSEGKYPTSPHTLKIELLKIDKSYMRMAKTINYVRNENYIL